jgi:hypothetical protein
VRDRRFWSGWGAGLCPSLERPILRSRRCAFSGCSREGSSYRVSLAYLITNSTLSSFSPMIYRIAWFIVQ